MQTCRNYVLTISVYPTVSYLFLSVSCSPRCYLTDPSCLTFSLSWERRVIRKVSSFVNVHHSCFTGHIQHMPCVFMPFYCRCTLYFCPLVFCVLLLTLPDSRKSDDCVNTGTSQQAALNGPTTLGSLSITLSWLRQCSNVPIKSWVSAC